MAVSPDLLRGFLDFVPHNRALGVVVDAVEPGVCVMRLPWAPELVGDPATGALHGGVLTTLIDACSGAAVFMALDAPMPIATLDLRVDHLAPSRRGVDVVARATCFKVTRNVAFVRCEAFHEPDEAVALGTGSFMLATKRGGRRAADEGVTGP